MIRFLFSSICACSFFASAFAQEPSSTRLSLINPLYIHNFLTHEAPWADTHNARGGYLGCGMMYYALAYMSRAKVCVCLGSGGGFVPRMMRQAQRDLNLSNSKTILVDADVGEFGRPHWLCKSHFFRKQFPEIEIVQMFTKDAAIAHPDWRIDYLHIDADHSFEGAYGDFVHYLPLMKRPGIITLHDTAGTLPCAKVVDSIKEEGYEVVNFQDFGEGFAIIYLH